MPVTPKERMQYVQSLTRLLPVMRTAAGISQEELAIVLACQGRHFPQLKAARERCLAYLFGSSSFFPLKPKHPENFQRV